MTDITTYRIIEKRQLRRLKSWKYFFELCSFLGCALKHIVLIWKFHRIGGAPPETFPNVKYDAPEEVGGDRIFFDSPIRKWGLVQILNVNSSRALTLCSFILLPLDGAAYIFNSHLVMLHLQDNFWYRDIVSWKLNSAYLPVFALIRQSL